mmetsp:Transcript_17957/g.46505  ORF Transcript_17957/g.46505 Transcript_17957/m.46505 type:complete len:204 (-) Transcript_17957:606-1217(-)
MPGRLGLPQAVQFDLGLADGQSELVMLLLPVQKLGHDVHDIRETGDLADLLKAVFGGLALLRLLEGVLLQAIPAQLFHRIDLAIAAGRRLKGLVGCVQSNLVSPPLKLLAVVHLGALLPGRVVEVVQRPCADLPLLLQLLLHVLETLDASNLLLVHPPAGVLPLLHLVGLPPKVLLHDLHLLLHDVVLPPQPRDHVLIHVPRL